MYMYILPCRLLGNTIYNYNSGHIQWKLGEKIVSLHKGFYILSCNFLQQSSSKGTEAIDDTNKTIIHDLWTDSIYCR